MKKILVIDDDESTRNMMRQLLQTYGFEALLAEDGIDGLYMAKHNHPDLILLDVAMAELDGIETCKRIKAFKRLHEIPVIMVSAMSDKALVNAAMNEGAADYLEKSFSNEELISKIKQYLK